jgi:uroporphyrinogen-III synthase
VSELPRIPTAEGHAGPLAGRRIMLTRPRSRATDFESRISALGGEAIVAPAIAITPPETWTVVDAALRRIATYDWIAFTSVNAVDALVGRADAIGVDRDTIRARRLAAVGPTTAAAITTSLRQPDVVAPAQTAASLAHVIVGAENARVLFPRGDLAGGALADGLRRRRAFVDEAVVYRTIPGDGVHLVATALRTHSADAVLFSSASAVRFVADALASGPTSAAHGDAAQQAMRPVVLCVGPVTAAAARAAGFAPAAIAESATQDDLIDHLARWFAGRAGQ